MVTVTDREYAEANPEVVDALNLEYLSADLDRAVLEELSATAHKFGFLDSEPDLDQMILD